MSIKEESHSLTDKLVKYRRHFHMNPELGFQETETSKFVQNELDKLSIPYKVLAKTGVLAEIRGEKGDGKTILIRADMDALPLQEDNDAEYKSKVDGVMHACGHDVHIACLLGVATVLSANKDKFRGRVVLAFQPAEEGPGGAKPMVEEGALGDDLENPEIDASLALHVVAGSGEPAGSIGVRDGEFTASADEIYVTVFGKGGHGSSPNEAVDPVFVAAQIVTQVQGYLTRTVSPLQPHVLTFGKIDGGTRQNIIPETASLEGTLRTMDPELRAKFAEELPRVFEKIASIYGARAETRIIHGYPVGINDKLLNRFIRESTLENYGEEMLIEVKDPTLGAEDFYEFGLGGKIPAAMFWLSGENSERGFVNPNHSNYFDIDESCLPVGTTILADTAIRFLND